MIFSKYLFTTVAALAGGVNAWAFTSSGGATIGKELEEFSDKLESNSFKNDGLINGESKRIDKEKKESGEKFQKLNNQNNETKKKSRSRRESGASMQKESYELDLNQRKQNRELNDKRDSIQSTLQSGVADAKQKLEESVKKLFENVKSSVDDENQKLSLALKTLTESNQKLISRVKKCIEEMPNSIFIEPDKLKKHNNNYCDYIHSQPETKSA